MNDSVAQYIPQPNEHQKAFSIAPPKENITQKILDERKNCFRDKSLPMGAKTLFCYLVDFSLLWTVNRKPGVITISTTKLSEELGCSKRALFKWKRHLVARGFIWITPWAIPNAWPIDTYHISIIDPPNLDSETTVGDGMWGNGARRAPLNNPGNGARRPGQLSLTVVEEVKRGLCTKGHRTKNPDLHISAENAPASGTKGALPVAQNAPGSGKICDGEPQTVRRGVANNATGSRTKEHLPAANNAPGSGTEQHSLRETQSKRMSLKESQGATPPSFEQWKKKLNRLYPRELESLKAQLLRQQKEADQNDQAGLADISLRLEAIDFELLGGKAPAKRKVVAPAAEPAKPKAPEQQLKSLGSRLRQAVAEANR